MRKSIASVVCPRLEERMTKRSANLTGLVLGCIEANFCKKILVGIAICFEKKIEKRGTWKETEK